VTAVLVEVGRSGGGWAGSELVLTGSSRLLTCVETQVCINMNFKRILSHCFAFIFFRVKISADPALRLRLRTLTLCYMFRKLCKSFFRFCFSPGVQASSVGL
jgi:hypothetical protein